MAKRKDLIAEEKYNFLRSGKLSFSFAKFADFWSDTQRHPGPYLSELVRYVAKVEQGNRNPQTSVELALSSLALLMFNYDYDSADEHFFNCLRIAQQKWEKHRRAHSSLNPVTEDIITCALRLGSEKDELMSVLLTHASTLPTPIQGFDDLSHISCLGQQVAVKLPQDLTPSYGQGSFYFSSNPKFSTMECGEFSLTYNYLKRYIFESGGASPVIIDNLCLKFQEVKSKVAAGSYQAAESCLLPLMRIVENIILQCPISNYTHLEQLLVEIDVFRRWPLPYGSASSQLVDMICKELKSPGSAMIQKMSEEWPLLDINLSFYDISSYRPEELDCWPVFIIVDSSEGPETSFFYKVASHSAVSRQDKLKQALLKVQLSRPLNHSLFQAHIYRIWIILFKLSLFNEISLNDVSCIAGLNENDVFRIYSRVLEIPDRLQEYENEEARRLQEEVYLDLLIEMNKLHADEFNPLTQVLFTHFSAFKSYRPTLPKHLIKLIEIAKDHITELRESELSVITELDDSGVVTKEEAFSIGALNSAFTAALGRSLDPNSPQNKAPVRVVLTGSDELFHKFLLSFVTSISNESQILGGCDLRVFVVPTYGVESSLAQYLASVDSWYQRHVYIPFAMRPWAPKLDSSLTDHKAHASTLSEPSTLRDRSLLDVSLFPGFDRLLPVAASETLLQDYLLEANRMLSLNIYEVHCWLSEAEDSSPNLIIPFGLYVDIGVNAAAKRLQQRNPGLAEKSLAELISSKNFSYDPLQVTIQATQMDLFGVEYTATDEATRPIYSLSVSNIPRETESTTPAIPNAEWLELSYLEPDSATQLAAYLNKKKSRKNRDLQADINVAVSTLYSNLHIIKADFISRTTPMDILVDGVLYGPFHMVRVKPFILEDRIWPTVPLMTYCEPDV
jgi:hypothetical protein